VFSGTQGSYGQTVVVEHATGLRTRYAHLSATLVEVGDVVRTGQSVGLAGSSGRTTGPHVHFELLDRKGTPLDPRAGLKLLDSDAD
jgi:murein DD-endopeptidase MepM/ murein hydrolase activator NlpD